MSALARFSSTQTFDLTPLPLGDCLRAPSVPTFISSTLAAERKTGTAGMSNRGRASGTTWVLVQEWNNTGSCCLKIRCERLWCG